MNIQWAHIIIWQMLVILFSNLIIFNCANLLIIAIELIYSTRVLLSHRRCTLCTEECIECNCKSANRLEPKSSQSMYLVECYM